MAPRAAVIRQTCCCFNVRIATTALAVYHVVSVQAAWDTVCACVCVRAAPIYGDPLNGRTVAHHLLLEPWTSPCPAPGLGLLLCPKRERGPCSSGRSGRRGPCSKQTYLTFSLRLSFCLCEMGPLAATSSSRYKRSSRCESALEARNLERNVSWDHCQEMGSGQRHGAWATGGDENCESPLCASRGEGGCCILLAYIRAGCLAWPECLWAQLRRNGPRGSPLEAGVHSRLRSLVSY